MKPTNTIPEEMFENDFAFDNNFFNRYQQRHAPSPLQLNDKISKNYLFPTFYGDVTCAIGIFLCSYDKAQAMLPHPAIKPVRMTRGRSLVIFSCYEYKNVMKVAPYNEIAMTIPIMVDPAINIPVLPMLLGNMKKFGYYVFSMPVTSLENQIRGVKIWGLPKVVQEIDIHDDGDDCVTVGKEETGETYIELRVPKNGSSADFDVSSNLYTRLGDDLLQSETNFKATFNVNKYMGQLFKKNNQPDRPYLTLGDTPSGKVLQNLEIEPHPFQFRYATGMSACFDLANPDFKSPIKF
jgi:acetoacetate decarboxylase